MPADRLSRSPAESHGSPTSPMPGNTLEETVHAVLEVLAGIPLRSAADRIPMEPTDLAAAVELYRQAGRRALEQQAAAIGWWQLYIEFTDWQTAEKTAADHLAPLLNRAEADGSVTAWWFIRKHPCWRLRTQLYDSSVRADIAATLDELTAAGRVRRWWPGTYEPETAAFGGVVGMRCAHELFHADSHAILSLLGHGERALGRRELSVLLCTTLMRAARLEWYEQGDVWHRVTEERPLPADIPPGQLHPVAEDLRRLMLTDTAPDGPLLGANGPVAFAGQWADAFGRAGRTLGDANREGTLDRGLRRILAYHVIFHWNRLGFSLRTQSALAWAARTAVLDPPRTSPATQDGEQVLT